MQKKTRAIKLFLKTIVVELYMKNEKKSVRKQ